MSSIYFLWWNWWKEKEKNERYIGSSWTSCTTSTSGTLWTSWSIWNACHVWCHPTDMVQFFAKTHLLNIHGMSLQSQSFVVFRVKALIKLPETRNKTRFRILSSRKRKREPCDGTPVYSYHNIRDNRNLFCANWVNVQHVNYTTLRFYFLFIPGF